jgi:integrase
MVTIKLRHVYSDPDRHGNARLYFWRGKGFPKHRIRETPGTPEFLERYRELLASTELSNTQADDGVRPGTYRWLCTQYLSSAVYRRLDESTQRTRRRVLEATCVEPIFPGSKEVYANFPLSRITTKALRVLRDRKASLPGAAADRVKAIRAVFKWAFDEDHVASNPARELSKPQLRHGGWHAWSVEEVAQFRRQHPIGTKAHLALALMLWTGVRRSDVVRLGRQHERNGWIKFTQFKNRNRNPIVVEIPILAELQRAIDASPCGDLTYLVNELGRPFTVSGFGNWFRDRCNEAGVPGRAHGLRKAGAKTAAENGATTHQLMAIFGWLTLAEAERYTRAAQRRRMAGDAITMLVPRDER